MAPTFAWWAGSQLAAPMHDDGERITPYANARDPLAGTPRARPAPAPVRLRAAQGGGARSRAQVQVYRRRCSHQRDLMTGVVALDVSVDQAHEAVLDALAARIEAARGRR